MVVQSASAPRRAAVRSAGTGEGGEPVRAGRLLLAQPAETGTRGMGHRRQQRVHAEGVGVIVWPAGPRPAVGVPPAPRVLPLAVTQAARLVLRHPAGADCVLQT